MFDIGFSELLVIGVVALLVIGPERLPRVARTAGHLMGRLQRYVTDVRADIQREMEMEELRRMRAQVEEAARSIESTVHGALAKAETDLNRAVEGPAPEGARAQESTAVAGEPGADGARTAEEEKRG